MHMKRALLMITAPMALVCAAVAADGGLPKFESDEAIDHWLIETSPFYAEMVENVTSRGTYRFRRSDDYPRGVVLYDEGQRYIELNDALQGAERVSILIFEMTNAFQELKHAEVDAGAQSGRITTGAEFSILHELIELDGLRLHRKVLEQIDCAIGGIPKEMLQWINPKLTTLASYELPLAYDWVKAQEAGGHGAHYRAWFEKQVGFGRRPQSR